MPRDALVQHQLVDDNDGKGYAIVSDQEGNESLMPLVKMGRGDTRRQTQVGTVITIGPNITVLRQPIGVRTVTTNLSKEFGLLRASYEEATPVEFNGSYQILAATAADLAPANFRMIARIRWGCGGAFFENTVDLTPPRGRFSFVAEGLSVSVQLYVDPSGPIDPNLVVQVSGILGENLNPDFATPTFLLDTFQQTNVAGFSLANMFQYIVSNAPCQLKSVSAWDSQSTTQQYLMIFDTNAGAATAGQVPKFVWPIPPQPGVLSVDFERSPATFTAGCFIGVSTTPFTFTASGAPTVNILPELVR